MIPICSTQSREDEIRSPYGDSEIAQLTRYSSVSPQGIYRQSDSSPKLRYSVSPHDGLLHVFEKHKTSPLLGSGAFLKVFSGTEWTFREGPVVQERSIALGKAKYEQFNTAPFELLDTVPLHPRLLARPLTILEGKRIYIPMDKLETPALFDECCTVPSEWDQWATLVEGMLNASEGLSFLHEHGILHRDSTLENTCRNGIFDYGAICKADQFHPVVGAALESLPQEILRALLNCPGIDHREMDAVLAERNEPFFPPSDVKIEAGLFSVYYTKAVDVYILGHQFRRLLGTLECGDHIRNIPAIRDFIFGGMLNPNPAARPLMQEVHAFLATIHREMTGSPWKEVAYQEFPVLSLLPAGNHYIAPYFFSIAPDEIICSAPTNVTPLEPEVSSTRILQGVRIKWNCLGECSREEAAIVQDRVGSIPFDLVLALPPSPYLLLRPEELYPPSEKRGQCYVSTLPSVPLDLATLIDEEPSVEKATQYFLEAMLSTARALSALHEAGFIHGFQQTHHICQEGIFDYSTLSRNKDTSIDFKDFVNNFTELLGPLDDWSIEETGDCFTLKPKLEAMLSDDPSVRPSMEEIAIDLDKLLSELRDR
ncbi:MAG: protein kinase family protein [Simkaniaceae bacterium]|nr:protein kinase family protein [Simkaniaceae bacterium]